MTEKTMGGRGRRKKTGRMDLNAVVLSPSLTLSLTNEASAASRSVNLILF